MLFSICIPSYNRGHRALPLVRKLLELPLGKGELEVICSNNGSEKNTEGYGQMREICDERFHYHEFEENQGFSENVNQVIRMSQGDFCMLLSDEDELVGENLANYIAFLELHPEISLLKVCSSRVYADLRTHYAQSYEENLDEFYMMGNYISGTIYNRSVITDQLLADYSSRYRDNEGYLYYVHLFLDAYALTHGNFCSSDLILVEEGLPADTFDTSEKSPDETVPAFGTYESRLAQMHGFVEHIRDLDIEATLKFQMYIRVIERIAEQIHIQKKVYMEKGYDWDQITRLVQEAMKAEIDVLELPFGQQDIDIIHQFIDSIT